MSDPVTPQSIERDALGDVAENASRQTGEVTDVLPQSEQQEPMSSEETLVNSDSEEEEESGSDIDDYSLERQAQRATLSRSSETEYMELKESLTSSAVHATLSGLELRSLVSASADYSFPGEPQWKKERRQEMARAISVANSCLEREQKKYEKRALGTENSNLDEEGEEGLLGGAEIDEMSSFMDHVPYLASLCTVFAEQSAKLVPESKLEEFTHFLEDLIDSLGEEGEELAGVGGPEEAVLLEIPTLASSFRGILEEMLGFVEARNGSDGEY